MSTYIPLGKIPSSPEERKELLAEKVRMDERLSGLELTHVQRRVVEFLISAKGYTGDDIETNKDFKVDLPDASFNTRADIAINADDKIICVIKCVMSSLESWERHSMALCRIVEAYQIPYAIVTDGEHARILDVINGKLIAEGLDSIPSREEAQRTAKETVFSPYSPEKAEKEKRILHAFDAITCPASAVAPE
ncbi:MAG: hypothetical protein A2077_05750 [Nitrospirae bacterium GWC2_46_6]|nr:MAG: hypothetical protein A2077_05750 [Nitrospirae bacterium GWC2_46_6]OGW19879.1 MAG: hypothetical protein A2Z82_04025 [Nitrospirae bacterium GWA2_46_11]OGW23311.1 MAG: hypothetical protein A2X55_10975 [Nitrospirae bacterium GWB2_47_37]